MNEKQKERDSCEGSPGLRLYVEELETLSHSAEKKLRFQKEKPLAFFLSAMLAGSFVAIGVIAMISISQLLPPEAAATAKLIGAAIFAIALSLVYMAGAELVTGNMMIFSLQLFQKKIRLRDSLIFWGINWLGNLLGSVFFAFLFRLSGLLKEKGFEYIRYVYSYKVGTGPLQLFTRAILCNVLVCLAVWCAYRMKSESGRLILMFYCIFVFITAGFEHSVANMCWLFVGQPFPFPAAELLPTLYNLAVVTLGNFVGAAAIVAFPYYLAARPSK